ncbi:MAG: response regulator [Thermomicrobiales bacterium]
MPSALQRPHVLIVSDDRDLSDFLGEGLVYVGFWTSVIASALQAIEVFRLRSFDAMLIDSAIGGIGAVELVRRLRDGDGRAGGTPRTDIPILAIGENSANVAAVVTAGADQGVVAPIELEDLALAISQVVSGWRAAHPDRAWADAAALAQPES